MTFRITGFFVFFWSGNYFKNVSPFNIFGLHDMICGSSHFPWAKGEFLLAALKTMWHHFE